MKPIAYIKVTGKPQFPEVEIADLSGFVKLVQLYEVDAILVTDHDSGRMMFLHDRVLYLLRSNGYSSLEDYTESEKAGFPDSETFYDARNHNIRTFKEFSEVRNAGGKDKVLYAKAQKTGFVENFEKFKQRVSRERNIIPSNFEEDKINTALRLYEYAVELGFKDYGDFSNAFFVGFATENEARDARGRNFTSAAAYREATMMGMQNADDYKEAKEKGITSAPEFEKYQSLKEEAKGKYSFDQLLLINGLKRSENGKKFSVDDMKALLKKQEEDYFGNSIPGWYDRRLKTPQDFEALLIDNADLKDHGIYDSSKKTYEVSRMLSHRVLIDGANVAFGDVKKDQFAKAKLKNVLGIIKQLKEMRFKNIVVISDAALKHKTIDLKVMDDIEKEKIDYREAPAGKQADEIILDLARKGECYIVSNDLYREYRKRDEWVKENIDRVRIPFRMVKGEAKLQID